MTEATRSAERLAHFHISPDDLDRLARGAHSNPHAVLGAHPCGEDGVVVRAFHPEALSATCLRKRAKPIEMERVGGSGLFAAVVPRGKLPLQHRVRFGFDGGATWEIDSPYVFAPTLGDVDLYLFGEGSHLQLWKHLGAQVRTVDGVKGVAFAVWAPNAERVSVVGDFCAWDGRLLPMRQLGSSGVWELFVPGVEPGALYKFEIRSRSGALRLKTDPMAQSMEVPPGTASRVYASQHRWKDDAWMQRRRETDPHRAPMLIYEVHFGSWAWTDDRSRPLNYRELAPRLVEHVKRLGFTHIEPLPLAEHPYSPSWGYQVSGYYAPTSRFGTPDDFRWFVDYCHQHDVGVIMDWVPAHFPKDDFALRLFDGTALYEHDDPRRAEHPDWGTLIFNYGRREVSNFLVANALYWFEEFHLDGLRVDAVASMLYLDYSRKDGEWIPNRYGGNENLEAIDFLRHVNSVVHNEHPGAVMVAEESTAWGGVTRPPSEGGLGFTFKWNMGWMHDTLLYFSKESVHRQYHHGQITFSMIYEYTEHFINPLSHDEVVHGKNALLEKMPGDLWQKFANLRTLLAYQYTRPGKVLLFMGTELAPWHEWYSETSLDWGLSKVPERAALQRFMQDLGRVYLDTPALWQGDPDPSGCAWIDWNDAGNSVLPFFRRHGEDCVIVVMNLTPVPRDGYRIGAPAPGRYRLLLNTDDPKYHGSGYPVAETAGTGDFGWHYYPQSLELNLPPLAAIVLRRED